MSTIVPQVLTAEQQMELAIAKARELRKQARDDAKLALINNVDYVGYLASIEDEAEVITQLTGVMDAVNKMKPIVTTDGTKYSVNCYPVRENIFGPVASRVLGLITSSSAMFTDERQAEFQALTGVSHLVFTKAKDAIGSPAYFSKGIYASFVDGNEEDIKSAVLAVLQGLNIDIAYADKLSDVNITKWFNLSEAKAREQQAEYSKLVILDNSQSFTLED
ncbi:MAG: hypothetical protein ACMV1B_03380 [Prevotella sp.]